MLIWGANVFRFGNYMVAGRGNEELAGEFKPPRNGDNFGMNNSINYILDLFYSVEPSENS